MFLRFYVTVITVQSERRPFDNNCRQLPKGRPPLGRARHTAGAVLWWSFAEKIARRRCDAGAAKAAFRIADNYYRKVAFQIENCNERDLN